MAISVTWDGTTYSIPQSGEINWPSLTNFLVALGNKAAVADEMKQSIRLATVSPVTISDTADFAVVTQLPVGAPVTVNLPAGVNGRVFAIVDGKADAATNNITINAAGSDTIKGAATLVMNKDRQVVWLQYNAGDSDWKLINYVIPPGQVVDADISGVISTAGKVSGNAITSGTIGGSTAINTSGALTVGGAAVLNGNVTLGDNSSDTLTINTLAVSVPNNLNIDSNTLYVDASANRVGIGTASPTTALDVSGTAKATTLEGATVNAGALNVTGNTQLGDTGSDILTIVGGGVTLPNGLNFDSNTLVIQATDNRVGVGITSPSEKLAVSGNIYANDGKLISNRPLGSIATDGGLDLRLDGSLQSGVYTPGSNALSINTNGSERVRVDSTGNLGVGLTNPSQKLEVAGAASISGVGGNGFLQMWNQNLSVATPSAGFVRIYSKLADKKLYIKDENGIETQVGSGGTIDRVTQASHGFAVGDVLYMNGATYTKALNTAASTAEVVGVVSEIVDLNTFILTLAGEISGLVAGSYVDGSGTPLGSLPATGEAVFLSQVAGKLTLVEPTVVGSVSVPIGVTSGSGTLYVAPKRGVVVGGANARTQLTLANNTTATIQNVSGYDAGELAGWIYIDATTDYRFYVQAQFVRGADNNYDVSYQTSGDTPPAGFSLSMTNAGLLQYTMPNLAGFNATNSVINYALNAPAVGTNFPLSIDGSAVTSGTVAAARLPQVSSSTQGAFPASNSSLDDATATRLGLKQYLHGTAYNGGTNPTLNGPNVTSAQSGFSVGRASFVPYQMQDGTWRLRFTMNCGFTSATGLTSITISINGVIFAPPNQAMSSFFAGSSAGTRSFTNDSASTIVVQVSGGVNTNGVGVSGDVELTSKPTWAY